jgi:uncharacterized protein with ATP-grasp and redox domains
MTPPEIGMIVYKAIYQATHVKDPYKSMKDACTAYLLNQYDSFVSHIETSPDPLYAALRFAAIGNSIDLGANPEFEYQSEIQQQEHLDFEVCHYDAFKHDLAAAKSILYIADNAGETVLDRMLIERLDRPVIYTVRSQPIINDATQDDAQAAGIDRVATILSSGCDAPGTILDLCSEEFLNHFLRADMIISKGQGNYETLSDQKRSIFYILKVKCPVIADDIDIKVGSLVLIKGPREL